MTNVAATNPAFESAVRERFARQTFMMTLGAALELVEPGRVHIGLAAAPSLVAAMLSTIIARPVAGDTAADSGSRGTA